MVRLRRDFESGKIIFVYNSHRPGRCCRFQTKLNQIAAGYHWDWIAKLRGRNRWPMQWQNRWMIRLILSFGLVVLNAAKRKQTEAKENSRLSSMPSGDEGALWRSERRPR